MNYYVTLSFILWEGRPAADEEATRRTAWARFEKGLVLLISAQRRRRSRRMVSVIAIMAIADVIVAGILWRGRGGWYEGAHDASQA